MSLLDNNYDFDAAESMIDFKVKWHDPINHVLSKKDTTIFNLPKDVIYLYDGNIFKLYIGLIDKKVFRKYIAKLKKHYSIFSNRVFEDGDNPLYNHFGGYKVKVRFDKDTSIITINAVRDSGIPNYFPAFNTTIEDDKVTIKGAIENDIFYNVLCEIEKRLINIS